MIHARTPYQVYRAEGNTSNILQFNALPIEETLPYKVKSAEETLEASLDFISAHTEEKTAYDIAVPHAAATYARVLESVLHKTTRSQSSSATEDTPIKYSLFARALTMYPSEAADDTNNPSGSSSLLAALQQCEQHTEERTTAILAHDRETVSALESYFNAVEKNIKQQAKEKGVKVSLLRKEQPPTLSDDPADQPTPKLVDSGDLDAPSTSAAGDTPVVGRKRTASQAARRSGSRTSPHKDGGNAAGTGAKPSKAAKTEGDIDAPTTAAAVAAGGEAAAKRKRGQKGSHSTSTKVASRFLNFGRLRALTGNEKKAVHNLNLVIQLLAHVYANKYTELGPIFEYLKTVVKDTQEIIDAEREAYNTKEDKKPPEPFHETDLSGIRQALARCTQAFIDDDECRYEFDEDLVNPIAHACVSVINQIEGYKTHPFREPTPAEIAQKQAAREAAKAKREEAQRRVLERAQRKQELERQRAEEQRLIEERLAGGVNEDDLVPDNEVADPVPTAYVRYPETVPLGEQDLYERALYVWCAITSVPEALRLSPINFRLFLKGLEKEEEDENGLMEELTHCLLDVLIDHVRVSSPNTPRIVTRGKTWFDALVEFVGVASGNKKKRQQQRQQQKKVIPSSDDDDVDDDSSNSSSLSSSSSSDSPAWSSSSSSSSPSSSDAEGSDQDPDATQKVAVTLSRVGGEPGAKQENEEAEAAETDAAVKDENAADEDDNKNAAADGATAAAKKEDEEGKAGDDLQADEEEEESVDTFETELKHTMEHIASLRTMASWGNIDLHHRLHLLEFCVRELLTSEKVSAEADRLMKERETDLTELDKKLREIKDEAEKELKQSRKAQSAAASAARNKKKTTKKHDANGNTPSGDSDNDENEEPQNIKAGKSSKGTKEEESEVRSPDEIFAAADKKRSKAYNAIFKKQDNDNGSIIRPLGRDRFNRLYWRFPLDNFITVQTTPNSASFPKLRPPPDQESKDLDSLLRFDELSEEDENDEKPHQRADTGQTAWGTVDLSYLPTFVQGLDKRGAREAKLRKVIENMLPYLETVPELQEGKLTRSRAHTFGYINRLKTFF